MTIGIKERLQLLEILPAQGDVTTLRIVRTLREELSFTEEEHQAIGFKQETQHISWNPEAKVDKEFELGPKAREVIAASLKKLNDAKELPMDYLDLYEKFVEG